MTDRNERRAEREAAARLWAQWLAEALEQTGSSEGELVAASSGQISEEKLTHWLRGDMVPSPESALHVGRLLRAAPVEVLRAAGYELIADVLAASGPEPGETEKAFRLRVKEFDVHFEDRLAASGVRSPETSPQDALFAMILAADLGEKDKDELLATRAADMNRLDREAQAAEDALRAVLAQRIAIAAVGPTPAQVRAALAELQDASSMRVWDEFLDKHYVKARETGSFDLLHKFVADSWNTVLVARRILRDGPPPREQRVSGEEFVAAWEAAHPGQKLGV